MFYMVALALVYYCLFGDLQYMGPLFSVFGSCYVRMEGDQYTWIHYTLMWQVDTRIMPMSTRDAPFVLIEQQVNEKASGIYLGFCIQTSCIRVSVYRYSSTGWHTSALDIPCWWTIFDASLSPRSYGLDYVIYVMSQRDDDYSILLYTPAVSLTRNIWLTKILWKILYMERFGTLLFSWYFMTYKNSVKFREWMSSNSVLYFGLLLVIMVIGSMWW